MQAFHSKVPRAHKKYKSAFLDNLFLILESRVHPDVISWSDDGSYINVLNAEELTNTVLPRFYKHNKMASFIRQLNLYRFERTYKEQNPTIISYKHPSFLRGREDLLQKVERNQKRAQPKEICERSNKSESSATEDEFEIVPKTSNKRIKINAEAEKIVEIKIEKTSPMTDVASQASSEESYFNSFLEQMDQMNKKVHLVKNMYNTACATHNKTQSYQNVPNNSSLEAVKSSWEFQMFSKILGKVLGFDEIDSE